MTGNEGHGRPGEPADDALPAGLPVGLPEELPVELLADLHAGVLDEQHAAEVRRRVAEDPRAATVLRALDSTVAELAALPERQVPMPRAVADRIDAVLAEQAPGRSAPVPDQPGAARPRRPRRVAAWAGVATLAAAAGVAGVVALSGLRHEVAGTPRAGGTGDAARAPLTVTGGELDGAVHQALTSPDLGSLSDPQRLRACLDANGAGAAGAPLGAAPVTVDGRPGVLLVLPTGQLARFRVLVVGEDCDHDTPARLADHITTPR